MDFPQLGRLKIERSSGGEKVPPQPTFLVRPEGARVHHLLAQKTLEEIIRLVIGVHDVQSRPGQRLAEESVVEAGHYSIEPAQGGTETDHLVIVVEPKLRTSQPCPSEEEVRAGTYSHHTPQVVHIDIAQHVRFAEAEVGGGEHSDVKEVVVNGNSNSIPIPLVRSEAVDSPRVRDLKVADLDRAP